MAKVPNPIDATIGGRLRARRMLVGMSQGKLGESLGVSFQQIQKYEKGVNRISLSHAKLLAQALQVTPAYFLEGIASAAGDGADHSKANGASEIIEFLSSSEGVRLNRSFARISNPRVRKRLADLVAALADEFSVTAAETRESEP
jgi:transcriptional regulator with XRE-family HTH domain